MEESPGSKVGQNFNAAGGKSLPDLGQKDVRMVTNEGVDTTTSWQMVDITRPLTAVRQVRRQGNRVIMGLYGGVIQNIETGQETYFGVEDEIYTLDLWMPLEGPGFPGPGQ